MGPRHFLTFSAVHPFKVVDLEFRASVVTISAFVLLSMSALAQIASANGELTNDPAGRFTPDSSFYGRVTAGGRPVANAIVTLRDLRTGASVASVVTSSTGNFDLEQVPKGDYSFTVNNGTQEYRSQIHLTPLQPAVEVRFPSNAPDSSTPVVSAEQLRIPAKAQHELQKAQAAFSRHDIKEAEQKLDHALKIEPRFAAALALRAALRLGSGNTADALKDAEAAVRLDPNYPDAYVILASTLNALARFHDAERVMEQGLRLDPGGWRGHLEMARALLGQERLQPAKEQIERAMKASSSDVPEIHLIRGWILLRMRSFEEASAELQHFLAKAPGSPIAVQVRQTLAKVESGLKEARK